MFAWVCTQVQVPQKARSAKTPVAGVTEGCELPEMDFGNWTPDPPGEQCMLLTSEPPLQSLSFVFYGWCYLGSLINSSLIFKVLHINILCTSKLTVCQGGLVGKSACCHA